MGHDVAGLRTRVLRTDLVEEIRHRVASTLACIRQDFVADVCDSAISHRAIEELASAIDRRVREHAVCDVVVDFSRYVLHHVASVHQDAVGHSLSSSARIGASTPRRVSQQPLNELLAVLEDFLHVEHTRSAVVFEATDLDPSLWSAVCGSAGHRQIIVEDLREQVTDLLRLRMRELGSRDRVIFRFVEDSRDTRRVPLLRVGLVSEPEDLGELVVEAVLLEDLRLVPAQLPDVLGQRAEELGQILTADTVLVQLHEVGAGLHKVLDLVHYVAKLTGAHDVARLRREAVHSGGWDTTGEVVGHLTYHDARSHWSLAVNPTEIFVTRHDFLHEVCKAPDDFILTVCGIDCFFGCGLHAPAEEVVDLMPEVAERASEPFEV